ncbi:MAG: helix-turn-helix domain-containing protein [Aridibacter sp.]
MMKNEYAELLTQTLPAIIETEAENDRILEIINGLITRGDLSPDERKLLRLLTKLVEDFEDKAYPMGEGSDPLGVMLFMMEQHNLKQIDMIDVFGSRGRVSDVVNGKRGISKNHARKLAEKFNVSVDLFI